MNIDDWFQWPTKSTDPGVNFVVLVALFAFGVIALVFGAAIIIPVLIVVGIAKGVHWYMHRPTPTDQLYLQVAQRSITANFPKQDAFLEAHMSRFLDVLLEQDRPPAYDIFFRLMNISAALYQDERLDNVLPPVAPRDSIEEGRYRDQLIAFTRKAQDAPRTLEIFTHTLNEAYQDFIAALPPLARVTPDAFAQTDEVKHPWTLPLIDIVPDAPAAVLALIRPFFAEAVAELDLFGPLRRQLESNARDDKGEPLLPEDFEGAPAELVAKFLGNTPLIQLFAARVPFAFSDAQRFEHMHVIGGSGHGKTQLLQHLILNDLTRSDPPALIVIDSQGDMLRKIQNMQLFADAPDRLVIIDPEQYSPALNMFDTANVRATAYSDLHREQLQAGVVELYNYIFASIAAEMTSRQSTAFAFVSRLMLSIPGASIHTLRELMEDPALSIEESPFRDAIEKLEPTARAYFRNQFFTKRYADLRQQIARRLYGVLSVPAFDRMFSAKHNSLDMFAAMQSGKVVLVNTSKALLKSDASALFGRYMIALVIRAVYERVASTDRRPAFLIVDEASEYFDDNIQMLLEQARKFNVGLVLAHQHLDQLSTSLRSAIAANTGIKLAGGVNERDARALAPDMRSTAEFITSMIKHAHSTEFACHVRNVTGRAVRLDIPFGSVESAPTMSRDAAVSLVARNRARYAADPEAPRPAATAPDPAPSAAAAPEAESNSGDWRS